MKQKEIIALDMISIILGEGVSSRLNQNLIEKASESVFNMVSSCNYQFKDGSNFFVQANFKPEKKDIALKLIDEEINKLNEKINEREFNKAKKKILSSFCL
ncbi:MAG: insulinase family protein [Candidatus Melainabacteria bacterium]|nr:MAG: insulinase family protein [Candidatus Melainabacteria bacterium]